MDRGKNLSGSTTSPLVTRSHYSRHLCLLPQLHRLQAWMSTCAINTGLCLRRSARFKVNFAIKLFACVQQRRCVFRGRSHDLSEQGMAIYIPAELDPGQIVQIEFIVPETNQHLGVHAIVRDSAGFRCGVEFQNLTPLDQAALRRQCEALANDAGDNKLAQVTLRLAELPVFGNDTPEAASEPSTQT